MKKALLSQAAIMAALACLMAFASCKKKDMPGPNEVYLQNTAFTPATLTITKGTTVTWTNKDAMIHTVTANNGLFDSGDMAANTTFSYTFSTAGTYSYLCLYHSGMTGKIIVQ